VAFIPVLHHLALRVEAEDIDTRGFLIPPVPITSVHRSEFSFSRAFKLTRGISPFFTTAAPCRLVRSSRGRRSALAIEHNRASRAWLRRQIKTERQMRNAVL
jgi:hypothetical protein